jgi:hypothetical protein
MERLPLSGENINLKVFVYERLGTGHRPLAMRPEFYVCEAK